MNAILFEFFFFFSKNFIFYFILLQRCFIFFLSLFMFVFLSFFQKNLREGLFFFSFYHFFGILCIWSYLACFLVRPKAIPTTSVKIEPKVRLNIEFVQE